MTKYSPAETPKSDNPIVHQGVFELYFSSKKTPSHEKKPMIMPI